MEASIPFGEIVFACTLGAAIALIYIRWDHLGHQLAEIRAPAPIDRQRHMLTPLGADGRPLVTRREVFPDFPSAVERQRLLADQGRGSVIQHLESGQVRYDLEAFETWKHIRF